MFYEKNSNILKIKESLMITKLKNNSEYNGLMH